MTDYLERILALLQVGEDAPAQDWPDRKSVRPLMRGTDGPGGLRLPKTGQFFDQEAEVRPAFLEEIIQENHVERVWSGQGQIWNILPDAARNQEAAADKTSEEKTVFELLTRMTRSISDGPAHGGGAAEGGAPLLAQLRKGRQAVEAGRRRDAVRVPGQAQPLETGWERRVRREESQTQAQDTAQLVDRAFRRDARRYDGGFTLF